MSLDVYPVYNNVRDIEDARREFQKLGITLSEIDDRIGKTQAAAPTATDDVTKGWENGSTWIFGKVLYVLVDNTKDDANWQQVVSTHPVDGGAGGGPLVPATDYVGVFDDSANVHTRVTINDLVSAGIGVQVLTDLSDVADKTGTGTTVVMQQAPTINSPTFASWTWSGVCSLVSGVETKINDNLVKAIFGFHPATGGGAVNHIKVRNSKTAVNPSFDAIGSDANVGMNFIPQGEGEIQQRGHKIPGITVGAEPSTKTIGDLWFDNE